MQPAVIIIDGPIAQPDRATGFGPVGWGFESPWAHMQYKKSGATFVILLNKGDGIIEKLTEFCTKEKIKAGHFSGIGGVGRAEVAYFSPQDRQYHAKVFDRPPMEVLSLKGNVSLSEGKIKIHAHMLFSDSSFSVFGGHLNEARVWPMCEIIFVPLKAKLQRKKDEETGLFMLNI